MLSPAPHGVEELGAVVGVGRKECVQRDFEGEQWVAECVSVPRSLAEKILLLPPRSGGSDRGQPRGSSDRRQREALSE